MSRREKSVDIGRVITRLRREAKAWGVTTLDAEAERGADPFRILISTVLSQRTKDEHTAAGTERLFKRAKTPRTMLRLSEQEISELIYPVGFHRTKAKSIRGICEALLRDHGGRVPADIEEMCELPGVGRKTANLVMTHGFGLPAICVDVHVHRILNRLGYVATRQPNETEMVLREKLPQRHWIEINGLLVAFGQTICRPVSPHCSRCPIAEHCPRIEVGKSR